MSDAPAETKELPKDIAARDGKVNVQINGVWHQFPRGTRMIEACKSVGVEVPHYCYHPKLSSPGNCRMCLVQMGMPPRLAPGQDPEYDEDGYQNIGWMPRPVIACANTVAENMGIRTGGELVEEVRNGVMEFLLINHPLDCPICDQAGECRLQEFSVEHGRGESRFKESKVKKPKNVDIGPRIRLDDERCIMCSRCIRFMDEVADDPVLGFTDRGTHTTLTIHPERRLDHNYSLNTADLCPVGALTSNDFRFQMRVWFLKETKTIDTSCGTGVNITVGARSNTIHRVTPRENNEVNSSWMPDSHRMSFHAVASEARLTHPLVKEEDKHVETSWQDAIATAAAGLKPFSGEEVAVIASARMTNEELFLVADLCGALDTVVCDVVPRVGEPDNIMISADRNPNTEGTKQVLGLESPGTTLATIREGLQSGKIKALIVLGEDVLEDAGFTEDELSAAKFIVASHTHANATAQLADVVLPGAHSLEKRGSMINVTGRIQRLNQAVQAPGQALEDWEILRDLTKALGGKDNGLYLIEDVFKAMSTELELLKDLSLGKIGDQGIQLYETGVEIPILKREQDRVSRGEIVG
ncbi:molybdopterin-dependent oxidoreductase [Sulfuriroseicoccus oceanibius]|uniref:Molybdopterin-dependent oxidoreductase n=1 Tax=Sulfuriroseicoccus oceanibius TaxID=2707525 RepID=A0A6B3L9A0_9BACT|nr:molybdopterin-dependent oxidoreductase [Sulfuriroseicoccus oceanibius]QQL44265.1 molybdopterin-dependent oxidoreductase [Sulfuriroseicoccus oceanibius]